MRSLEPSGQTRPRPAPPQHARQPRRVRYLLCGLLTLPLLAAMGFYLTRGPGPAAASAPSQATARQAPATGRPFHTAVASVPPSSPGDRPSATRPSAVRPRRPATSPTPAASASSRPASPPAASAASSAGASSGSPAAQVLALINRARSAAGLPPLTITAGLDRSASAHNSTMAAGCGLSHQCPGEPDLGARETAAGVIWSACGENIGEGGPVADTTATIAQMAVRLTQDMLNEKPPDDGHRQNILSSSFTHIGIAVHRDPSGTVWLTQDFSN